MYVYVYMIIYIYDKLHAYVTDMYNNLQYFSSLIVTRGVCRTFSSIQDGTFFVKICIIIFDRVLI